MKKRSWTKDQLIQAVQNNMSIRGVIVDLGLKPAGGNYKQINKYIKLYKLRIKHFTGMIWSKGKILGSKPRVALKTILVDGSSFQSYKLKMRLFREGLKREICEECGWCNKSSDGRIPVELDHINGNPKDNRIENLRILCPNCHSLKPSHRERNIGKYKKVN